MTHCNSNGSSSAKESCFHDPSMICIDAPNGSNPLKFNYRDRVYLGQYRTIREYFLTLIWVKTICKHSLTQPSSKFCLYRHLALAASDSYIHNKCEAWLYLKGIFQKLWSLQLGCQKSLLQYKIACGPECTLLVLLPSSISQHFYLWLPPTHMLCKRG